MQSRKIIFLAIAGVCMAAAIWLAWPSRNFHGNPALERVTAECRTAAGTVVRVYEGNGGATSAYWYTVTAQGGFYTPERQVLFAYGSPVIDSLSCGGDGVRLVAQTRTLTMSEADIARLRHEPRTYWRGTEKPLGTQPLTLARYGLAAVLALISVALWVFRRRKAALETDSKNIN